MPVLRAALRVPQRGRGPRGPRPPARGRRRRHPARPTATPDDGEHPQTVDRRLVASAAPGAASSARGRGRVGGRGREREQPRARTGTPGRKAATAERPAKADGVTEPVAPAAHRRRPDAATGPPGPLRSRPPRASQPAPEAAGDVDRLRPRRRLPAAAPAADHPAAPASHPRPRAPGRPTRPRPRPRARHRPHAGPPAYGASTARPAEDLRPARPRAGRRGNGQRHRSCSAGPRRPRAARPGRPPHRRPGRTPPGGDGDGTEDDDEPRGRHFPAAGAGGRRGRGPACWPPSRPSPSCLLLGGWAVDTAALSGQVMRNVEVSGRPVGGLGEASLPDVMDRSTTSWPPGRSARPAATRCTRRPRASSG